MHKWLILLIFFSLAMLSQQVRAVDYKLPDMEGKLQSFDQYIGKWVIVNYWATWCSTCRYELPELIDLDQNTKEKIKVVGVNFENINNEKLKQFIADKGITYPILRSSPIPVTALGKVPALPTTFIIDPSGKVVAGEVGIVTRKDIEDYIKAKQTSTM